MTNNNLIYLPKEINLLKFLKTLKLDSNKINILPKTIGDLRNLEILSISKNKLTSVPSTIGNLGSSLRILDISYNKIKYIPKEIENLVVLTKLYMQNNNIEQIPNTICNLKKLKVLILEWSEHLPSISDPKNTINLLKNVCSKLLLTNLSVCTFADYINYYGLTETSISLL